MLTGILMGESTALSLDKVMGVYCTEVARLNFILSETKIYASFQELVSNI